MSSASRDELIAVYDTRRAPPTFDFFVFLGNAWRYFEGRPFTVVFRPNGKTTDGFKDITFPQEERQWRLWNLLLPMCAMFDASPRILSHREEPFPRTDQAGTYPIDYHGKGGQTAHHTADHYFMWKMRGGRSYPPKTLPQAKEYVGRWLKHRGAESPVVITLRTLPHDWGRNCDLREWDNIAREVSKVHPVVIVPDQTDAVIGAGWNTPNNVHLFPLASMNVLLRYALYGAARTNLGVPCGPLMMCATTELPYIMFKVGKGQDTVSKPEYLRETGVEPGGDRYPWAVDGQVLDWGDDSCGHVLQTLKERGIL